MNGACEQCKAGHYRQSKEVVNGIVTATTTDATKCVICPAGWTSEEGSTKCQWCEAGSYSDEEGKECSPCKAGRYRQSKEVVNGSVTATTTDATKCVICPAGWISEEGSTKCQLCEAGSYNRNEEGKECSPCTKGQYRKAGMKASSCRHCIAGQYQTEEGQASW